MMVPCMVKVSLYVCAESTVLSGRASCVRMRMANTPANKKNAKELTRYMIPIFL